MKIYCDNPKIWFDYEIQEKLEVGMVLAGHEVKSVKNGKVSLRGSFVKIISAEAWLVGAIISPYQTGNISPEYDPQKTRKLLLKKSELNYLIGKAQEKGFSILPLKLYDQHGLIKLEIGIGRGKKKYDKRETIKKRETERKIRQIAK